MVEWNADNLSTCEYMWWNVWRAFRSKGRKGLFSQNIENRKLEMANNMGTLKMHRSHTQTHTQQCAYETKYSFG